MKDSLLVPVVFLLCLILVTAVLFCASFFYLAVSGYNPASGIPWKDIFVSLPSWLPRLVPVIVSLTVLFVSMRIHRKGGLRFLSQLILAAVSFITLILVTGFMKPSLPSAEKATPVSPVIITNQISIFDQAIIYLEDQDGPLLRDVYVKRYLETSGSFTHYSNAFIHGNTLEDRTGNSLAAFSSANPVYERLFNPPEELTGLFEDISITTGRFSRATTEGGSFRFLVFGAFILFCIAIQAAGVISRWPLINNCLALALFRGLFYIYRVTTNKDILDFIGASFSRDIVTILPELTLLTITLVLFLLTLLKTGRKTPAGVTSV